MLSTIAIQKSTTLEKATMPYISSIVGNAEAIRLSHLAMQKPRFKAFFEDYNILSGDLASDVHHTPEKALFNGYLFHSIAGVVKDKDIQIQMLSNAIVNYDLFLESNNAHDPKYFAQWQKGLAQEELGMPWSESEETLLMASQYKKDRAEAFKHIIQHYRSTGELGLAYMYSTIVMQQHFGKTPAAIRWGVDPAYYQWKVLNYHISICNKLGNAQEAAETFSKLWKIYQDHPDLFSDEQAQTIFQNQQIYQQ